MCSRGLREEHTHGRLRIVPDAEDGIITGGCMMRVQGMHLPSLGWSMGLDARRPWMHMATTPRRRDAASTSTASTSPSKAGAPRSSAPATRPNRRPCVWQPEGSTSARTRGVWCRAEVQQVASAIWQAACRSQHPCLLRPGSGLSVGWRVVRGLGAMACPPTWRPSRAPNCAVHAPSSPASLHPVPVSTAGCIGPMTARGPRPSCSPAAKVRKPSSTASDRQRKLPSLRSDAVSCLSATGPASRRCSRARESARMRGSDLSSIDRGREPRRNNSPVNAYRKQVHERQCSASPALGQRPVPPMKGH
ncbi:hypothetical protein K505DRAFT_412782 [Melanomma pulvis-pyrius CBS 109.77]|uniref:Uncharacterized protein n=1 Tax=Melanomma pulvis-pyrius CBS 109.77 TaxID=1314802 RepID=A0A6A6XWV4_9PLEO|nr:hypothetical protein K505DRAFT_412782 [Melanomma pulvis-pyrius CBS 109.77]